MHRSARRALQCVRAFHRHVGLRKAKGPLRKSDGPRRHPDMRAAHVRVASGARLIPPCQEENMIQSFETRRGMRALSISIAWTLVGTSRYGRRILSTPGIVS